MTDSNWPATTTGKRLERLALRHGPTNRNNEIFDKVRNDRMAVIDAKSPAGKHHG